MTEIATTHLEALEDLTLRVLRGEHPKPTLDEATAAAAVGDLVFHQELGYDAVDDVLPALLCVAGQFFQDGLLRLASTRAPLEHLLARVTDRRWSVPIETAAVTLDPRTDRVTLLLNPFLLLAAGPDWTRFILAHESRHLLAAHLLMDRDVANDPLMILATEIWNNAGVKTALGCDMLQVRGKAFGIDPEAEYRRYRERAKEAQITPVSKEEFFSTDMACFAALSSLPTPPKPKQGGCGHNSPQSGNGQQQPGQGPGSSGQSKSGQGKAQPGQGDEGKPADKHATGIYDDPGFGGGLGPLDRPEVDEAVRDVLHQAVKEAMAGNEQLKQELLELGAKFPNSTVWGSIGLGALRGEKPTTKVVAWWEQHLARAMASRMEPSDRLSYNRKIGWWYPFFTPSGKEPQREVAVFIDMSGSISPMLAERIQKLMGSIPDARVRWFSFDTEVYDLGESQGTNVDIKPLQGGGGTDFGPIVETVAGLEDEPDAVLVLTDGYAARIAPTDAHKWIWLVTPGGDAWMADAGMETVVLDETFSG